MKVILLKDVAKLGRRHDVVEAPNGYAMNKLIPQKMALAATPEHLKQIESRQEARTAEREAADANFDKTLETLKDKTITIKAEANEQEHLFSALQVADIIDGMKEAGADVDASHIHIKSPIKELGEHTIELHAGDKTGAVTISVEAK